MSIEREKMHWINLASSILSQQEELRGILHRILKDNKFYAPPKRFSGGRSWRELIWFEAVANSIIAETNTELADKIYLHRLQGYVKYGYTEDYLKHTFDLVSRALNSNISLFAYYLIHTENKTLKGLTDLEKVETLINSSFKQNDIAAFNAVINGYMNNVRGWVNDYEFTGLED